MYENLFLCIKVCEKMVDNRMKVKKPSVERAWLKYYPENILKLQIPECSVEEYLRMNCPGESVAAMHYYGNDITWQSVFEMVTRVEKSLRAMGVKEGDQIPVFLRNVPEFLFMLLAAERIGASVLCRDNTLEENVEAVVKSGSKVIFAQDFLSREEQNAYLNAGVKTIVLLDPCFCCRKSDMPEHILNSLQTLYPAQPACGEGTVTWIQFLALGSKYNGSMSRPRDIHQPLYRAYTSGSTGPSKQVIHSANSILSVVHQMNFYGSAGDFRPTWMVTALPPALVAVVVSMVLAPLSSNKLLILDPFVDPLDVDLELMRYQPNIWPGIPMFIDVIMNSKRIPVDYDMSFLFSVGAGAEAYNNVQIRRVQKFLEDHNCAAQFTTGYGCSEGGSSITMPMVPGPYENGSMGVPLPLTTIGIFKPGTQEELGYNQLGEICRCGPGNMLGYDNPEATAKVLQVHPDGQTWLHIGDTGYIDENGVIYSLGRGAPERFDGGELPTLPMENLVADANIPGIDDEFFVIVEDGKHPGFHEPYLCVVLKDGYTLADIQSQVMACLPEYQRPVKIFTLPQRPYFHFKTNRIGLAQQILAQNQE